MNGEALTDPREGYPEEGVNAYAMHEPPDRMDLLADLLKETRRIEKHASWLEQSNDQLHRALEAKRQREEALTERVVRAERAIVNCEQEDSAIHAALYMETMDEDYVAQLRAENEEARSLR